LPILKKSTTGAKRIRQQRRRRDLDHDTDLDRFRHRYVPCFEFSAGSLNNARARRTSDTSAIIGT